MLLGKERIQPLWVRLFKRGTVDKFIYEKDISEFKMIEKTIGNDSTIFKNCHFNSYIEKKKKKKQWRDRYNIKIGGWQIL